MVKGGRTNVAPVVNKVVPLSIGEHFMKTLLPVAAFTWLAATSLLAQTYGEITGAVTDPSGSAVTGAGITITNLGANQIRQVTTPGAGKRKSRAEWSSTGMIS